jgi:hypothetical protein
MNDWPFQYSYLHPFPEEQTVRAAVHLRLHRHWPGRSTKDPQEVIDWYRLFQDILSLWRDRTRMLSWRHTPYFARHELCQVRNCQLFGVVLSGLPEGERPYICGHPEICPWCAAREADTLYRVTSRLYQPGDALCRILATYRVPAESADDLRTKLKRMRKILRGLCGAHQKEMRCSYWSVSVEPARQEDRPEYLIRGRWLALFWPSGHLLARPTVAKASVAFLRKPTWGDFQHAVAQVCAYPTGLLHGPLKAAGQALQARFGLGLTERAGAYRGFAHNFVSARPLRLLTR